MIIPLVWYFFFSLKLVFLSVPHVDPREVMATSSTPRCRLRTSHIPKIPGASVDSAAEELAKGSIESLETEAEAGRDEVSEDAEAGWGGGEEGGGIGRGGWKGMARGAVRHPPRPAADWAEEVADWAAEADEDREEGSRKSHRLVVPAEAEEPDEEEVGAGTERRTSRISSSSRVEWMPLGYR
jgi:hypothetical protein